jgi:hypothetical protein
MANINKIEKGNSIIEYPGLNGISNHKNKVIKNENIGDMKNKKISAFEVYINSFPINFNPSANG